MPELPEPALRERLIGHQLLKVVRRGKVLIADLDSGAHLVVVGAHAVLQ